MKGTEGSFTTGAVPQPQSYVLLTDAPPLKQGGHGCHVLAWNWVEAMGNRVRLVVTHRLQPRVCCATVRSDLTAPVLFYPDLCTWRLPSFLGWLKSLLEVWLFVFWLARHADQIRNSGADRLFAFFGSSGWFLWIVQMAARRTRLPLDVYLVDDLEQSAQLNRMPFWAKRFRRREEALLRTAERVFAISPGYVEHLGAKYDVAASWLPIVIPQSQLNHQPYQPIADDVRSIVFLGAVNELYIGALKDFLMALAEWNAGDRPYRLRLSVLTYSDPALVRQTLGVSPELEIVFRCGAEEFAQRLRGSWAVFLPYAFSDDVRTMVSTSFPTKLVESLSSGRPVLVYGPDYASVPRYFLTNALPLCVTRRDGLLDALRDIEKSDSIELTKQYQALIERFHSPNRLMALLESAGATPASAGVRQ